MELENGSLIIGYWDEAPVKLNWTILLSVLIFGRFQFVPVFWIAFFLLIFIHEAGHVLVIRHYNLWVAEIVIHGLGGYCRWGGEISETKRALIAWGGVFAQSILLAVAYGAFLFFGPPQSAHVAQLYHAFIHSNIFIILFNLIPIEPLDGARAWKIITPIRDSVSSKFRDLKYKRQDRIVQQQITDILKTEIDDEFPHDQGKSN